MSAFQKVLNLTYSERELVLFDSAFREILNQLQMLEDRTGSEGLEGVKDLLNSKTYKGHSYQTNEFDLAQAILLVVNRIETKED